MLVAAWLCACGSGPATSIADADAGASSGSPRPGRTRDGTDGDAGSSRSADERPSLDGLILVSDDPPDSPLPDLPDQWQERFDLGDVAFEAVFRPSQGLGPVYIRHSCGSCHANDSRGPGAVRKMVNIADDGISPAADQSMFPFGHTVRPQSIDTENIDAIDVPEKFPGLRVSSRLGPAVFGRGAMEAILDSEIERLEAEQASRDDGISGRINRVTYNSEANPDTEFQAHEPGQTDLIGRFGVKARIASLDEFTADAYQGDMGITSPMRPSELPNPDGYEDDQKEGLDVDLATVNLVGDYVRLLRIPARKPVAGNGEALFEGTGCAVCHAPSLATDPDYPIAAWAGKRVDVYTDMLLHSMGSALADGIEDGDAAGDEWRTAPLVGVRHLGAYLHDGRAKTVREAIEAHSSPGSEANGVIDAFDALDSEEQDEVVEFVESL